LFELAPVYRSARTAAMPLGNRHPNEWDAPGYGEPDQHLHTVMDSLPLAMTTVRAFKWSNRVDRIAMA
jgi:hypothetical protein